MSKREEAYGEGILAGHDWWQNGYEGSRTEFPPCPHPEGSDEAAEWWRGFNHGDDDAAAEDGW